MSEEKIKGVITKVSENGEAGEINCGKGRKFSFTAEQLQSGYSPVLKDIVEFSVSEEKPCAISLFHRQTGSASNSTDVDLKIKCPHCGEPMMPRAKTENGAVVSTFCPKCNKLLEKFDAPPKVNFVNWILGILIGILLTLFIYWAAIGQM